VQRALEIMIEGRGTQFDAACLDAFLQVMAERGIVPGQNQARPQVAVSG
jgi:HD-GYP domain-containing protein (c-di-GMP phosphodiesterase class II)